MAKINIFKKIKKEKVKIILIILIVVFASLSLNFFLQYSYIKNELIQKESTPDIELGNSLSFKSGVFSGWVVGFVSFKNEEKQPRNMRQYVEITASKSFNKENKQIFYERDIIKMDYLAPKYFEPVSLTVKDSSEYFVILTDSSGNLFSVDKNTGKVSMLDTNKDTAVLITSDYEYADFMRTLLRK